MSLEPGPVLSVRDLTVRFAGAPAAVVDGISIDVKAGRTLAIVGESGCGKSVTSMALMGLLPAHAHVTAGATTGLPWNSALEFAWSWNFGLENAGEGGPSKGRSGFLVTLTKVF